MYTPRIPSAGIVVVQFFAEFPVVCTLTLISSIEAPHMQLGFLLLFRCQTLTLARALWACF